MAKMDGQVCLANRLWCEAKGPTTLAGASRRRKECRRLQGIINEQMPVLHDYGRQDAAQQARRSQGRFICADALRRPAGSGWNLVA